MKRFYTLALSVLMAGAAIAAPARLSQQPQAKPTRAAIMEAVKSVDRHASKAKYASKSATRAPGKPTGEFAPINELPVGATTHIATKSGVSIIDFMGYILDNDMEGMACTVATLGDKIYVGPILNQAPYDLSYMEGTVKDGVATFTFPQALGLYDYGDGDFDEDYAVVYDLNFTEEDGEEYSVFDPSDDQTLSFTVAEDGSLTIIPADEEKILGVGTWYPTEPGYPAGFYFSTAAEIIASIDIVTDTPNELPIDVRPEAYNLIMDGTSGYEMEVGIDGDKIYLVGINSGLVDGTLIGTIKDNTATFPAGQFLGIDEVNMTLAYAFPCTIEEVYDDYYEEYMDSPVLKEGDITMAFDPATRTLTCTDGIAFGYTSTGSGIEYAPYIANFIITKPDATAAPSINKPEILLFWPEEDGYEAEILFQISNISGGVNIIPEEDIYYRIYLDGDLFEFMDDEYAIAESTTIIPYTFNNDEDIFYDGYADVVIYPSGFKTIGVQAVYMKDGEVLAESEITTYDADSIKAVSLEGAKTLAWYDLSGRRVASPAKGLYIKQVQLSDGSIRSIKTIIK